MHVTRLISTGVALAVVAVVGTAGAVASTRIATKPAPTISTRSSPYGKILVNNKGFTLYLWAKDKKGKSACSGACSAVWPFVLSGKPTAGSGVNAKLLGTIKVKGGNEVTYDGHPLYTYISDVKAGTVSGEGSKSFGAPWWVISPAGNAVTKKP